jgi:protein KRI1
MGTDKELNEFMGIKRFAPYRSTGRWDNNRNERLQDFRKKLNDRNNARSGENEMLSEPSKKKRKGKKERMRLKVEGDQGGNAEATAADPDFQIGDQPKKRNLEVGEGDDQPVAEANGANKKRRKRKHHKEREGSVQLQDA